MNVNENQDGCESYKRPPLLLIPLYNHAQFLKLSSPLMCRSCKVTFQLPYIHPRVICSYEIQGPQRQLMQETMTITYVIHLQYCEVIEVSQRSQSRFRCRFDVDFSTLFRRRIKNVAISTSIRRQTSKLRRFFDDRRNILTFFNDVDSTLNRRRNCPLG